MKSLIKNFRLTALAILFSMTISQAQENDVLPGENFSLEGALELFKKAASLEDFEKALNDENSNVNNLDLNDDGEVDYIRVIDNMDSDAHAIVLQVPVNQNESQDIAVIEIEKTGNEEAVLQIIGDEDVYGEQTIVEPFEATANEAGQHGPHITVERLVVNVWGWPSVRFVFAPNYRVWVSPYRWRRYPSYWHPWRPRSYSVWRPLVVVQRPHYQVVNTHRVGRAHAVYTPKRVGSKTVHTRTTVVKTQKGTVKKSTTTVKGKNGKVQKRSTTVQGKRRKG